MSKVRENHRSLEDLTYEMAYVYVEGSEESKEAVSLLRKADFCVATMPVSGLPEPKLKIGQYTYRGLQEIKKFIKQYKQEYKHS